MDKKLNRLDTLHLQGSDGKDYTVYAYEHLVRLDGMPDAPEHWNATGQVEYKLAGGSRVDVDGTGQMRIAGSEVTLRKQEAATPA